MHFHQLIIALTLSSVIPLGGSFGFNPIPDAPTAASATLHCGDTDGDGRISILDCALLQKYLSEFEHAYPYNIPHSQFILLGDADQNGSVNVRDVTTIQRYLAELPLQGCQVGQSAFSLNHIYKEGQDGQRIAFSETAFQDFVFNMENTPVADYLANASYSAEDYSVTALPVNSFLFRTDRPAALTLTLPQNAYETVLYDSNNLRVISFSDAVITNLIPGKTYHYVVKDRFGVQLQTGSIRTEGHLRMIDAGGSTFNIRDLGGWKCDGGTMQYGKIYRGCELDSDNYHISLTEKQKSFFLNYLNIRDDIDLRGNAEVDGPDKTFGTEDDILSSGLGEFVDYIRLPVAPYTVGVNLSNPYQKDYYATMLKRIAYDVSNGKPCYIHCMAGADRTGTLCAIVEAICGMSAADIDCDYELTSFARGNTRARTAESWQKFMAFFNSMEGDTLRDKAVSYAIRIGVTMDEINALRQGMIDGSPEILR